jgi:DNA-directed RNA polymerase III subunit RPC6
MLVYQVVGKAGNAGIWTRDLKYMSGMQQTNLNKILKRLEARRLLKSVKSVAAKNRKM